MKLDFLGVGIPLFLDFIKNCIYVLLMILLISGVYNFYSDLNGKDCLSEEQLKKMYSGKSSLSFKKTLKYSNKLCLLGWKTMISFANKRTNKKSVLYQELLNLAAIIIIIIMLQFFRYSQRKINVQYDENNVTPEDYTVMLKGIPKTDDMDDNLVKQEIERQVEDVNVVKVCFSYDLSEYYNVINSKSKVLSQKKKKLNNGLEINDEEIIQLDYELENIKKKLSELELKYLNGGEIQDFTGFAFVSFRTESEKETFTNHFKPKKLNNNTFFTIKDKKVRILRAPEPSDVLWKNLHYSKMFNLFLKLKKLLFFVIVIFLIYFIFLL